jgi:hypothetical protein
MTLGEIKQLATILGAPGASSSAYEVGKNYLIRSVTTYNLGRVVAVTSHEIVLAEASWVPNTGRFHTALSTGVLKEIEPWVDGVAIISRGGIVDAGLWKHDLPRAAK